MIGKFWMAAVGAVFALPLHATTLDVLFGDEDGFGGQTTPGVVGADTSFSFDNQSGGDPASTDKWLYVQGGGVSPIDAPFVYDLTGQTAVSAVITLIESGMSDNRGPWNALFNGHVVGSIPNLDIPGTITAFYAFIIDPTWLTGSDTFSLIYDPSAATEEGFALDYVKLSIETVPSVPVPAALPLLAAGIGGLAALRRRKKG